MNQLMEWIADNKITGGTSIMLVGGGCVQLGTTTFASTAAGAGLCVSGGILIPFGALVILIGVVKG